MATTTTAGTGFEQLRASMQAELLARTPNHIERLRWSRERIESSQRAGLRALLAGAIENSPFHRRRLGGIDPSRFALADLGSLPVMTKAEMMESLDEVFTDRRLNRGRAEQALAATVARARPDRRRVHRLGLGWKFGSAWPLRLRPGGIGGLLLGSAAVADGADAGPGRPAAPWTAPRHGVRRQRRAYDRKRARLVGRMGDAFRVIPVPATLPLAEIVERLNALRPPVLYGYASMLARLAAEQRAGRLRIAPMSVTSTSETLTTELRAAIAEAFGAPVVDTFGSTEGLLGTSAPDDEVLVFNSDLCIAELVDAENRPVPTGVPSAKVLLTNLYNQTQPLIRYELMDSFVRQPDAPEHGHLRAKVRGRMDEVLHFDGVDIHPHVVRSVMVKSAEILDFQARQTPRGMDVDALAVVQVDGDRLADRLREALAEAGLRDPAVTIRLVDHLERIPDTGKIRRFLPLP
jgi:phenylacetate-CoA ligase